MTQSAGSGSARAGKTRTPCSHKPRWRRIRSIPRCGGNWRFVIGCNAAAMEAYRVQTGEIGISLPDPIVSDHPVDVETVSERAYARDDGGGVPRRGRRRTESQRVGQAGREDAQRAGVLAVERRGLEVGARERAPVRATFATAPVSPNWNRQRKSTGRNRAGSLRQSTVGGSSRGSLRTTNRPPAACSGGT